MADTTSRTGASYATPAILDYTARLAGATDDPLAFAFQAPETNGLPAIQVGPNEGRFLGWLVALVGARRVLEVGTLAGYSAVHMARALPPDGILVTMEKDERAARVAAETFARAGLEGRVELLLGDAVANLPLAAERGPYDLVFLDADKGRYDVYLEFALANLRPSGLVVGDNAFFFGDLLGDGDDARAMRRFHERLAATCDTVTIPTPDGLAIGRLRGGDATFGREAGA